jgi:signal transduction histidine kinase
MENISDKLLLDELAKRLNRQHHGHDVREMLALQTEVLQLGMRLREAENSKSQFLSNVRNEVNNPLAAIMGLAESISRLASEEKVKQMSVMIEKQASELEFQMRNIIMAADIESGELTKKCSLVDIGILIKDQIAFLRHRIEDRGARIELTIQDHLKFPTDADLLRSICLNLFSNAIEYCGTNKLVMIDVTRDEGSLLIQVRDFGAGIEPSLHPNIGQRFKQGDTGLRKKHCGHGLGLCIVKELTGYLEGSIGIESSRGKGTTVIVRIPGVEEIQWSTGLDSDTDVFYTESEIL